MNRSGPEAPRGSTALKEQGIEGFPVRWSMRAEGLPASRPRRMELTRVEKKSLPASLFEVPAGYKQTDFAVGGLTPEQEKHARRRRRWTTP